MYTDTNKMIDGIPIDYYMKLLGTSKMFSVDRAIEYTNEVYNINISSQIDKFLFQFDYPNEDIYEMFETNHPRKQTLQNTREYFQNQGRNYFLKFLNLYARYFGYDALVWVREASVVHHIHPLVYGGSNDLLNLIHISDILHGIIHENPKEESELHCHRALNYLGYLVSYENFHKIVDKYSLGEYQTDTPIFHKMFKACLEEEMQLYYSTF